MSSFIGLATGVSQQVNGLRAKGYEPKWTGQGLRINGFLEMEPQSVEG
ncbi:MAG: hypothetical protein MUF49_01850 [Oculatellaceae cyanobacterium Prado106]|nr:hypothetical protein [Oculatellaceae cyanobacterium Prado106]